MSFPRRGKCPNTELYMDGPEITPYLDIFHAVFLSVKTDIDLVLLIAKSLAALR